MKKKFLSFILTGCMIFSLFTMGASAASSQYVDSKSFDAVSSFAGEKVTCNIAVSEPDGTITQKQIIVEVPDSATKDEAQSSIMSAAEAAVSPMRAARFASKTIYQSSGRVINIESSGNGSVVAAFSLDANYDMLGVMFTSISPFVTSLNCSLMNTGYGTTNVYWLHQSLSGSSGNKSCSVYFKKGDKTDGGTVPSMSSGQNYNVLASCTTSQANIAGIADVKVIGYQGIF